MVNTTGRGPGTPWKEVKDLADPSKLSGIEEEDIRYSNMTKRQVRICNQLHNSI